MNWRHRISESFDLAKHFSPLYRMCVAGSPIAKVASNSLCVDKGIGVQESMDILGYSATKARPYRRVGRTMTARVLSKVGLGVQDKAVEVEAIFDTGATRSFVSLELAEKLGYTRHGTPKEVLLATKDKKALMVGELVARIAILGYELPLSHVFGAIEGLNHDTIIGMDIMEPYEIVVDAKEGRIAFRKFPPTIEII